MKYIFVFMFVLFNVTAFAKTELPGCEYKFDPAQTTMIWTAYKTKKKAPVKGQLKAMSFLSPKKRTNSLAAHLNGAVATVDGLSVDSKNPGRDDKIREHFFKKMAGNTKIKMKIERMPNGKVGRADVRLTMNEQSKIIPMVFKITDDKKVQASGNIDILDWKMTKSLEGIAKACSLLHGGKTWSEVGLEVVSTFKKTCP